MNAITSTGSPRGDRTGWAGSPHESREQAAREAAAAGQRLPPGPAWWRYGCLRTGSPRRSRLREGSRRGGRTNLRSRCAGDGTPRRCQAREAPLPPRLERVHAPEPRRTAVAERAEEASPPRGRSMDEPRRPADAPGGGPRGPPPKKSGRRTLARRRSPSRACCAASSANSARTSRPRGTRSTSSGWVTLRRTSRSPPRWSAFRQRPGRHGVLRQAAKRRKRVVKKLLGVTNDDGED